jgi:LacI family transcriptional regulator
MLDGVLAAKNELMKRRVTIKQIAEKAGLSVATVDRVINSRRTFRRATAIRVQSAAKELGHLADGPVNIGLARATGSIRSGILLQRKASPVYQGSAHETDNRVR